MKVSGWGEVRVWIRKNVTEDVSSGPDNGVLGCPVLILWAGEAAVMRHFSSWHRYHQCFFSHFDRCLLTICDVPGTVVGIKRSIRYSC